MQSKMETGDIGYVHTIQASSGWGKTKLAQIGAVDSNVCDLCGKSEQDTDHNIWYCEALKAERMLADPDLAAIDPSIIHEAVRRGVAPAMSTQPSQTFWGSDIPEHYTKEAKRMLGARHPPSECSEARNIIVHAKETNCNARQLISVLRGGFGQGAAPNFPEAVVGRPALKPEVFTDGGVKNPTNQMWALGGFGMWTKTVREQLEKEEIAEEKLFYHQREADQDFARWGPLAGFGTSSTRNELAAGILGLMLPRAVHIGSDSKAFVDKANSLKRAARHWNVTFGTQYHSTRNPCGKPWGMQVDGDLWLILWEALLIRGPATAAFTWVKGHATEADIAKGISDAELRNGNRNADKAATEGTDAHRPGLLALTRWAAARHAAYIKFMHKINAFYSKYVQG